jgi:uncharacterized protein (TIGR00288 family)
MGMRSDLSKELKTLLDSDIIKGKVSVQRAYADWRRYPQYIVPLSEASVDLIFAPAYGSNKKNATDIRMAIDAVELVFIRPEIGTFILLTGDSDFSSLVLKLKEYGKYVIGVGIQESTSDILVQNCDEYYSYTTLTGLKKTTESDHKGQDPWILVKDALKKMTDRADVMRSDRLKQVMQEISPSFDEGALGFSKFSKFLAEASSRGLVALHKLDNGQYEVAIPKGRGRSQESAPKDGRRDRGGRGRGRGAPRERESREEREQRGGRAPKEQKPEPKPDAEGEDPLDVAYALLTRTLEQLRDAGRVPVRDSDVKRKMLELNRSFDEAELGFSKFSRFLAQAGDHGVVQLTQTDAGNVEVTLGEGDSGADKADKAAVEAPRPPRRKPRAKTEVVPEEPVPEVQPEPEPEIEVSEDVEPSPSVVEIRPSDFGHAGLRLGPRRGSTRRRGGEADGPILLAGQAVPRVSEPAEPNDPVDAPSSGPSTNRGAESGADDFDASALGLPSEPDSILRYLTHRYRGVGEKTAESLVQRFGADLFRVLRDDPDSITAVITPKRAEQVLEAWRIDYDRRTGRGKDTERGDGQSAERGSRRGGRRRGPRSRDQS